MCSNIISALYPLYFSQFLMGGGPIEHSKNYKYSREIKIIYDYSATAIIISLIIIYIIYQYNEILSQNLEKSALMKFINIMFFITVMGFSLVSFSWSKIHKNSTKKLWKKLYLIDSDLKNAGLKLNYTYIKVSSIRFLIFGLVSINVYILYLLLNQKFADKSKAITAYGLLYFGMLNHMSVICSFLTLIRTINHILDKIIKKIKIGLEESKNKKLLLKKIMSIYHDLYNILKLVNTIFSAQILLSFALSFVFFTFQSYNIVSSMYNHSPYLKYSVAAIIFTIIGIIEKFVIAFVCHKCMFKVSRKM